MPPCSQVTQPPPTPNASTLTLYSCSSCPPCLCWARACFFHYDPAEPFQPVRRPFQPFPSRGLPQCLPPPLPTPLSMLITVRIVAPSDEWTVSSSRSHTLSEPPLPPHRLHMAWPQEGFLKRFYLFVLRQRGRERGRERNINVWLPPTCPLLGT